jgi:hypothetical protein
MRKLQFSLHALKRMVERDASPAQVRVVVEADDCIEEYPDDKPSPARLLFGIVDGRALHVVAARASDELTVIVTVYEPDPARWDATLRKRVTE